MTLIAKKQEDPNAVNFKPQERFELFSTEVVKDVKGKDVTIPKSMGSYSLTQLEDEKARLNLLISEIDAKIQAINDIINTP